MCGTLRLERENELYDIKPGNSVVCHLMDGKLRVGVWQGMRKIERSAVFSLLDKGAQYAYIPDVKQINHHGKWIDINGDLMSIWLPNNKLYLISHKKMPIKRG